MSSPTPIPTLGVNERKRNATATVRRQRGSLLRRHWLTAAFVFGLVGLITYIGTEFYEAEAKLARARETRAQVEDRLADARRQNQRLKVEIAKVTDDAYLEVMAKAMGFVYPQETPYQLSGN